MSKLFHEVPVPRFDELLQIPGEYKLLNDSAQRAQGCLELDPVGHCCHSGDLTEFVNVPKSPERTLDLLIHEVVRRFHLGDLACHAQRDAEVPSSPRHLFSQSNQARSGARNSFLS
ncbi:hypothetical protein ACIQXM_04885 [Arthrobacter sp. NPDC097144]|uniref:hypothetical protein n=1 Tax=Arthrobacter sp. NPDC097144 TaxID=3363946 RepID=UPI00382CA901